MNPQMKAKLDVVCHEVAKQFETTPTVVQLFISTNLLATKLLVVGDNANDKKMDIRATMRQCTEELTRNLILACQFLDPVWDASKVMQVYDVVGVKALPIVRFFYFGIKEEERKDEDGKIIIPN